MPSLRTAWVVAVFRSRIWLIARRACSRMEKLSISAASASATSTRHTFRTAGMRALYLRRRRTHFSAGTCSPISALTSGDIIGPAMAIEDLMHPTSLGPTTAPTIRKLAELKPTLLATMHGASFSGNGAAALKELGDHFDKRLRAELGA